MRKHQIVGIAAVTALVGSFAVALPQLAQAAPSTLMFSAYVEGSGSNKAIEVYNPSSEPLSLAGYSVKLFSNGQTSASYTWALTGTIAGDSHLVLVQSKAGADLLALADEQTDHGLFNGDDALQLQLNGAVVDSFGQTGYQPTDPKAWEGGGVSTLDRSLLRGACETDTIPTDPFDPSAQWIGFPKDDFSVLGTFSCSTDPNPSPQPTATQTTTLEPSDVIPIGVVQGTTDAAAYVGKTVTVEGIVTSNFKNGGFNGYTIQDGGDGDPNTSDAIFVYDPNQASISVGDRLRLTGPVSEYFGQTQLNRPTIELLSTGNVVAPTTLQLPVEDYERYESMLLTFPQDLTIAEYFDFDRYGTIVYTVGRQFTPTAVVSPGTAAQELLKDHDANRLIVDDARTAQNPSPAIHPNGKPFTRDNMFRGGDSVANLTGVMSYNFEEWKLQPTQPGDYTARNPRPEVPKVGGDLKVASLNVLNYFTTLTSQDPEARGADTVDEFERQQQKIVATLAALDADIVGLMEIENNGTAVENLVTALNSHLGEERYAALNTGVVGTDVIFQALIYRKDVVAPVGSWQALDYQDNRNRPTLLQTFEEVSSGERLNVAVNHLKSKGSACSGEPNLHDGAGECNETRVKAATAMVDWLAGDPTGQGEDRTLVIGDLNSYDHELPISTFAAAGYTDLEKEFGGEYAYGYVFDGMLGYLDYALSNSALTDFVTGAQSWNINADESDLFDYDTSYKLPAEQALFAPDPYRSSDHDPVLIGLDLQGAPSPSPTPSSSPSQEPSPSPSTSQEPTPSETPTSATPSVIPSEKPTATADPTGAPNPVSTPTRSSSQPQSTAPILRPGLPSTGRN